VNVISDKKNDVDCRISGRKDCVYCMCNQFKTHFRIKHVCVSLLTLMTMNRSSIILT